MLLPPNSSLVIQVLNLVATGPLVVQTVQRTKAGTLEVSTREFANPTATVNTSIAIPLMGAELIYYSISHTQSGVAGGTSCVVNLVCDERNGNTIGATLSWGAVYNQPIHSWMDRQLNTGRDIQCPPVTIDGANPAAGAAFEFQFTQFAYEVESISTQFVADATVASRTLFVLADSSSAGIPWRTFASVVFTAGQNGFCAFNQQGATSGTASTSQSNPIARHIIQPNGIFRLSALGIQAGDQFSAIAAQIRMLPIQMPP